MFGLIDVVEAIPGVDRAEVEVDELFPPWMVPSMPCVRVIVLVVPSLVLVLKSIILLATAARSTASVSKRLSSASEISSILQEYS